MSPLVRLVGASEPKQIFISIEDVPIVLSDLRRSLPDLAAELRRIWPVESVYIEEQRSYRKNPFDPSQLVIPACIGLVVIFVSAAAKAAGSKIGDAIGEEVTPYVRRWVKARFRMSSTKRRHKKRRR